MWLYDEIDHTHWSQYISIVFLYACIAHTDNSGFTRKYTLQLPFAVCAIIPYNSNFNYKQIGYTVSVVQAGRDHYITTYDTAIIIFIENAIS